METKQHTSKQPLSQRINQKGNEKVSQKRWKGKHNISNIMGHSESSSERKIYNNKMHMLRN